MVYTEYIKAAQRHRATCEQLINRLKDKYSILDVPTQNRLLQNSYYLSGYIIECSISHAFFRVIDYDKGKTVYELTNNNSYGYHTQSFLKDHSIEANNRKIDVIIERGGVIPSETKLIGSASVDELEMKMYVGWNAKSRYTCTHLNFEINITNITKFFDVASNVYIKLSKL